MSYFCKEKKKKEKKNRKAQSFKNAILWKRVIRRWRRIQYLHPHALFSLSGAHKSVLGFLAGAAAPAGMTIFFTLDAPRCPVPPRFLGYIFDLTFSSSTALLYGWRKRKNILIAAIYSHGFSGRLFWYDEDLDREDKLRLTQTFRWGKETFSASKLCSTAALTLGSDVNNSKDYSSCLSADTFIHFIAESRVGSAWQMASNRFLPDSNRWTIQQGFY